MLGKGIYPVWEPRSGSRSIRDGVSFSMIIPMHTVRNKFPGRDLPLSAW